MYILVPSTLITFKLEDLHLNYFVSYVYEFHNVYSCDVVCIYIIK